MCGEEEENKPKDVWFSEMAAAVEGWGPWVSILVPWSHWPHLHKCEYLFPWGQVAVVLLVGLRHHTLSTSDFPVLKRGLSNF